MSITIIVITTGKKEAMTVEMKIILKLIVKVKEIEEHVSHEGKRQKTCLSCFSGRVKRQMIKERTTKNTEENKG